MNYKDEFENLLWNDKSVTKPIYDFSYSVMKSVGSVIGFIYRTNKTLEEIHNDIDEEFVHPWMKHIPNIHNANYIYYKFSKLYLDIKTYWNMMGSIMLPIRNHIQNVNEIYTILQKYLDINVLSEIKFINFKYKELSDYGKLEYSDGYRTFVESLGFILNSIQQVQILSSIEEEKISDINWSFKEFMNVTLNKINTLEIDIDGEEKVISFFNMIEKILEYLKFDSEEEKTNSMNILLNCEIQRFVVALINVLIYKSYERMTEIFMKEMSYFDNIIKGKSDNNGDTLSTYEIKQIEEK